VIQELEDATVGAMVLAEGLEVPADKDEIAPGLAQPVRIAVSGQRPFAPGPVGEAVADVVAKV
jgi:hypothetical protein